MSAQVGRTRITEQSKPAGPRLALRYAILLLASSCIAGGLLFQTPAAGQVFDASVIEAGTTTRGGLVSGSKLIRVTSLADRGTGTLRDALAASGPRIIVFDVAGTIELASDLRISEPFVTIAGQTAPAPGILLRGNKLRIATHDVVVQHISVRPGVQTPVPNNADAISISLCVECGQETYGIRLENVSASWATDENIGLWGETVSGITVRNSLIAEALENAGHEKGAHSMGMLIGEDVQSVEVVGNLFVSNRYRNPVMGSGTSTFVANNYIYNPGRNSIHIYKGRGTRASIIGNVVKRGPDTKNRMTALQWQGDFATNYPDALVFADDNHCCDGSTRGDAEASPETALFARTPPVVSRSWTVMPADRVWDWVQRHAGSRPAERHPIDARILALVRADAGTIIDDPAEVGGYLEAPAAQEPAPPVPDEPFAISGPNQKTRIEAWLCLRHLQVGGGRTPECSESAADLQQALFGGD